MGLGEKNPYELIRIMYMKKITINAFSEKEARDFAIEQNLPVVRNVTPSWLKAGSPAVGTDAFYEFATAMMKKTHLENTTGAGLLLRAQRSTRLFMRFVVRKMVILLALPVKRRML